jgi:hypothetical protein
MKLAWFFFKMLFEKSGFNKSIKALDINKLEEYQRKAVDEENYRLAAFLKYYIEYHRNKDLLEK